MNKNNEGNENREFLETLFNEQEPTTIKKSKKQSEISQKEFELFNEHNSLSKPDSLGYSVIDISILPATRFYKSGTKIAIRPAKVTEIQSYSVVDDKNFVDITEKMNELLSRNVLFTHPDGKLGTYRDVKDADRMFLIFMIREMTFVGGHTLTKEVQCKNCDKEFMIPFRSTIGQSTPATFDLQVPDESIERFWNKNERCYELIHNNTSWRLGAPTIGIQEEFYEEIKRQVNDDKKPNISFMKIVPFLMYDRNSITKEGIKVKLKEYIEMDDITLFSALNAIVNKMTLGIKGLVMTCPQCGMEVHTEFTFPGGASTIFETPNILDSF
jgi:hypothetical protein